MATKGLRKEEGIGLVIAVVLHAAVLAAMMIRPPMHEVIKPPTRMEVTISDIYGKTSTSPDPFSKAAPDRGPELGEPAPPAEPEAAPAPSPERAPRTIETPKPEPKPQPKPEPKAEPKPQPKPVPKPAPKPVAKAPAKPKPLPAPKPVSRQAPAQAPARRASAIDAIVARPARSTGASAVASSQTPRKSGASSFAQAFSEGVPGATADAGKGAPAAEFGPKQVAALGAAINRQLKPYWQAPQGADAELLVTRVRFRLNADGSLAGEPQVLSTTGQNDANKAQVLRHQELAIRAVKRAAPFDLPKDLYDGWKVVTTSFDRRLSQ